MHLREATNADIRAIGSLNQELFDFEQQLSGNHLNQNWTYSESGQKYFTDRINGDYSIFIVAESADQQIVGYICGHVYKHPARVPPQIAEIENLIVSGRYRRQSIGEQLSKAFADRAKQLGASVLRVTALNSNELSNSFYRKNGFAHYETIYEKELT